MKDLLENEDFDPKKLFDEKEYSTLIIGRDGFSKSDNDLADLIESLVEKDIARARSEEIFLQLKEKNALEMLVETIKNKNNAYHLAKLIASIWESGLDASSHFLFFAELVNHTDYAVAMEALTVLEYSDSEIESSILETAKGLHAKSKIINPDLYKDYLGFIDNKIGE